MPDNKGMKDEALYATLFAGRKAIPKVKAGLSQYAIHALILFAATMAAVSTAYFFLWRLLMEIIAYIKSSTVPNILMYLPLIVIVIALTGIYSFCIKKWGSAARRLSGKLSIVSATAVFAAGALAACLWLAMPMPALHPEMPELASYGTLLSNLSTDDAILKFTRRYAPTFLYWGVALFPAFLIVCLLANLAAALFSEKTNQWLRPFMFQQRIALEYAESEGRRPVIEDILAQPITTGKKNARAILLFADSIPDGEHVLRIRRPLPTFFGKTPDPLPDMPVTYEQIVCLAEKFGPLRKAAR